MIPLILDTDTGVDDALAICLACLSPELSVEAITAVHGNVPAATSAANVLCTLDVLGLSSPPPVALGADRPLVREPVFADEVHGWDGLGNATRLMDESGEPRYPESSRSLEPCGAVTLIRETISRLNEELTLVAVGPLTNVAQAIREAPKQMRRLAGIVVMGGCFRRQGNASPVAEFNIFSDPHAAQIVFDFDVPVTIIPLDVTEQVVLTSEIVERHTDHRVGRFVRDITRSYMEFGGRVERVRGCYIHDPMAVAYLLAPQLFHTVARRVDVETMGTVTTGQTIADLREPPRFANPANAYIALDVEPEEALQLFVRRVLGSGVADRATPVSA